MTSSIAGFFNLPVYNFLQRTKEARCPVEQKLVYFSFDVPKPIQIVNMHN